MSIIPVSKQRGSSSSNNNSSLNLWDQTHYWDDLFENFALFPSMLSTTNLFPSFGGGIFGSLQSHVDWKETPRAHVFRAVLGRSDQDQAVLVYIDDENMLEISTENGNFMSRFKLPENARRNEVKACMVNGVLSISVPKHASSTPNIRSIEISGSG